MLTSLQSLELVSQTSATVSVTTDLCPCWPRQQDIFCRHNYITTVTMPRQLFGSLNDQQCTTVFVQRTRFPFE